MSGPWGINVSGYGCAAQAAEERQHDIDQAAWSMERNEARERWMELGRRLETMPSMWARIAWAIKYEPYPCRHYWGTFYKTIDNSNSVQIIKCRKCGKEHPYEGADL